MATHFSQLHADRRHHAALGLRLSAGRSHRAAGSKTVAAVMFPWLRSGRGSGDCRSSHHGDCNSMLRSKREIPEDLCRAITYLSNNASRCSMLVSACGTSSGPPRRGVGLRSNQRAESREPKSVGGDDSLEPLLQLKRRTDQSETQDRNKSTLTNPVMHPQVLSNIGGTRFGRPSLPRVSLRLASPSVPQERRRLRGFT